MTYLPLKKEIVFDDLIKNNPYYSDAMLILKTCGDTNFKDWAVTHLSNLATTTSNMQSNSIQSINELSLTLANNLTSLVNREVPATEDSVTQAQALLSEPNPELFSLFAGITSFILNIQNFERAITAIESNIESGNIVGTRNHLTKDGEAPVYLPRSRQPNQSYRRK